MDSGTASFDLEFTSTSVLVFSPAKENFHHCSSNNKSNGTTSFDISSLSYNPWVSSLSSSSTNTVTCTKTPSLLCSPTLLFNMSWTYIRYTLIAQPYSCHYHTILEQRLQVKVELPVQIFPSLVSLLLYCYTPPLFNTLYLSKHSTTSHTH